jgi:hypothetical protein
MSTLATHPTEGRAVLPRDRIIHWASTALISAAMLWSAYNFALNPEMKGAFAHLGLPNWFKVELTAAKLVGALVLLVPWVPKQIKEFAYFGFGLTILSACIAHLSSGDGMARGLEPLVALGILTTSYLFYEKRSVT